MRAHSGGAVDTAVVEETELCIDPSVFTQDGTLGELVNTLACL